ncbi:Site-specific DNA recombinase [Nakamurella panacisegetis]|uniref:Site-specific DNA recombinase n=1 Tax=Nakamurella panacisegetis TaxID=1090615 RepID=A0A1H0HK29_9ACTN|nr:recombinase family protein [Nakamurella panacisegetis]SDO19191.1 Site-specific DNA recombinase [Nakamurella panacisegetis]
MADLVTCGIYARISSDISGLALGVQRQIADCTTDAERRGWKVTETYVDNDVSATRSKVRPGYQKMIADIKRGHISGLVVWDVDRLTRTPRELEDIIDLADHHGLALASVGGDIDLATPQGRMTARIKGTVARHETEQQSRRLKRKLQERAESGKPHGAVAYGYRRVVEFDERGHQGGVHEELVPEQAEVIRKTARLLLGGQSLRSVVAQLNADGARTPRGLPWVSTTLRQIMLRDRNAGLRTHLGQVIGDGAWPAVYDKGTHDRVVALLTDPGRRSQKGSPRRHLLTGIARCGRDGCEGTMVVNKGRLQADGRRQPPAYTCAVCTRVRRKQAAVDKFVESVMIARLGMADALRVLATGDPAEVETARTTALDLEARLDLAADQYADGVLTGEQLRRITERLRPRIETAKSVVNTSMPAVWAQDMAGPRAEKHWAEASLDIKRTLIDMLCTITVLPTGSGRLFNPSDIRIEWREAEA